jgi:hypothetical protein
MQNVSRRRFPAPWKVVPISGGFHITDANSVPLAYVYAETSKMTSASYSHDKLTVDEAFMIARWISRLPELISAFKEHNRD